MITKYKYTDKIEEIKKNVADILVRTLTVKNKEVYILFIPQLTNRDSLSENIIRPMLQYCGNDELSEELIMKSIIYFDDILFDDDGNKISDYVLSGNSVIIIEDGEKYIVANTIKLEQRSTESPEIESTIRAPRDAFIENMDSNLSLIRYRIKDESLKIDYYTIGKRTKTSVALVYMSDIVNNQYVTDIKNKLEHINADRILDSGYLQKFISNGKVTLFPQVGISERPDKACGAILDGKVCIIVNGSNLALIAPKTFIEFFDSADDHCDNTYLGMFAKFLRFLALIISLTLSALYVGLVAFHPDFLPPQYILALAASRVSVPVNAALEAILMEILLELLREANIRLPKKIGTSIGIVGTIVIGQALVTAGLVSSPIIIIVALSSLASYAVPDYTIMNPIRLLKFFMIFLTSIYGLFGFIMGLSIIIIKITSTDTFGIPYTAPVSPFNFKAIKNFILSNPAIAEERPEFLDLKDKKRK